MVLSPDENGECFLRERPLGLNSHYVASDFSVSSIVASGSYDLLKPVPTLSPSALDASDSMDTTVLVSERAGKIASSLKSKIDVQPKVNE